MAANILLQSYFTRVGIVIRDPPKRILDCYGCEEAADEHWDDKQVYLLEVRDDDKTYRHGLNKNEELVGGTVLRHLSDVIGEWGREYKIHRPADNREWRIAYRQVFYKSYPYSRLLSNCTALMAPLPPSPGKSTRGLPTGRRQSR
jgi:hypothetical protein